MKLVNLTLVIAAALSGVFVLFMAVGAHAGPGPMATTQAVVDTENQIRGNSVVNEECEDLPEGVSQRTKILCNAYYNFDCVENPDTQQCNYVGVIYERSWGDQEPILPWEGGGSTITEVPFGFPFNVDGLGGFAVYCINLATGESRQEFTGICNSTEEAVMEITGYQGVYVGIYGPDGYFGSVDSESLENLNFPEITVEDLLDFTYDQNYLDLYFDPDTENTLETAVRATSNGVSYCKYQVIAGPVNAQGEYSGNVNGSCFHP